MDNMFLLDYDYNLMKLCRLCLVESNKLIEIFDSENEGETRMLIERLMAFSQIMINEEDGMPTKICEACTLQLNSAYDFKLKCEQSDATLREYLLRKNLNNQDNFSNNRDNDNIDEEYNLTIKPEITFLEVDPLNENNFYRDEDYNNYPEFDDDEDDGGMDEDYEEDDCDDEEEDVDSEYDENDDNDSNTNGNDDDENKPKDDIDEVDIKKARTKDGRYECHLCGKTLGDPRRLKLHLRLHTGHNLKRCNVCNRGFATQSHLSRHMLIHAKDRSKMCKRCGKVFPTPEELKEHMNTSHGTKIKKEQTNSLSDTASSTLTDTKDNNEFNIDINCIDFKKAKTANGRYACHLCPKTLIDVHCLKLHLRLHTGQNLKRCTVCNRGFAKQNHLTRHMMIHAKDKSKLCKRCGKTFESKDELKLHMDTSHITKAKEPRPTITSYLNTIKKEIDPNVSLTNDNDSNDVSKEMDNEPTNIEDNVEQEKVDDKINEDDLLKAKTEDGRYACHLCDKTLVDPKGLQLHLRLHTGQNLKRCTVCKRGFVKQNHLIRHMVIHANDKDRICKRCGQCFESKEDLKTHMENNHQAKTKIASPATVTTAATSSINKKRGRPPIRESISNDNDNKDENTLNNDTTINNYNIVAKCKICDITFHKINLLRQHLNKHKNIESIKHIDLKKKNFLFDISKIDINAATNDDLINYIINEIDNNETNMVFYQINNSIGDEMYITDSESDDDSSSGNGTVTAEIGDNNISNSNQEKKLNFYLCEICKCVSNHKKLIFEHIHKEHVHDNFLNLKLVCNYCQKIFPNYDLYNKHIKRDCENKLKMHKCKICNRKFLWDNSLTTHLKIYHKINNDNNELVKNKEKNCICYICNKTFYRQENLDRHLKIHSPAEKKFECTVCEKKFNRKDNLRSHMKIHKPNREEGDKHLCVYCGRSFSNSSNLIVHMRRHTGEKPYKCDLCDKGFPRSSDLQCHRRTHTGEKPCLCTICGKGFSRSNKLVRHMRIHTGVRPYKCMYCERAFTQSNDLTLHIRRHTGDKPYVCGICGDRFIQGTALQAHRRMQGHYEENTSSPFSNISVNNPNRYTNANRVNRIGLFTTQTTTITTAHTTTVTSSTSPSTSTATTTSSSTNNNHNNNRNIKQEDEIIHNVVGGPSSRLVQPRMPPATIMPSTSFGLANNPTYIPNGMPFLSNTGVLMQNLEVSTLLSAYNQSYNCSYNTGAN